MSSLVFSSGRTDPDKGAPLRLLCELAVQPLSVTTATPRLSWWVNDRRPAEMQSAYEILAASSLEELQNNRGDLWETSRVDESSNLTARYAGAPLQPLQRVWWKVRTYDSDGEPSPWSEPACFETAGALLDDADARHVEHPLEAHGTWKLACDSEWIGTPLYGSLHRGVPVNALRRTFDVPEVPVKARLYVATLGDFRLEVNGVAVAESVAAGVWSDYRERCWYQSFDLTNYMVVGANAIGILLADGFYAGGLPDPDSADGYAGTRAAFGAQPQLRASLAITLSSGRVIDVCSDQRWQWRTSWVLGTDPMGPEHVDARQVNPRWSLPGSTDASVRKSARGARKRPARLSHPDRDSGWQSVEVLAAPPVKLLAQNFTAFGIRQVLRPINEPLRASHGAHRAMFVYDFGVCLSGRVRIELASKAVDDVQLEYGLTPQQWSSSDSYTSAGRGDVQFATQFATHTFRYVRVTCDVRRTLVRDVVAMRIGVQQAPALQLRSDHATLNGLFDVLQESLHTVAQSLPLRGIERAQRLPDFGYALTWAPLMARDLRTHGLVSKWLHDLLGYILRPGASQSDHADHAELNWGEPISAVQTLAHTAWALYRHHGDQRMLEACYPTLRAEARAFRHLDGWPLAMTVDASLFGRGATAELVCACSLLGTLRVIARMAAALRRSADAELLWGQAADLRQAIRRRYISQDGHLFGHDQSACVAALHWDLLEGAERRIAQTRLLDLLQESGYETDVVPGLTPHLLPVLTQAGRLDVAYMVLLQTSADSWLGNVLAGTGYVARKAGVFDIAQVGIAHWMLQSLVGIALPDEPADSPGERASEDFPGDHVGYRRVRIAPMPPLGKQFLAGAPVQMMHAQLATVSGEYMVAWRIGEERFELELVVPPSCSAEVVMPDGIAQWVSSGRHEFHMSFGAGGDGVPTLLDMTEALQYQG